ncbi:MAG: hypothetical protein V7707_12205 [Motiliproteus sp.]
MMRRGALLSSGLLVVVFALAGCSVPPSTATADRAVVTEATGSRETAENQSIESVWQAAKQRGVDFRAVGNEPAWLLEISDADGILLQTDYGTQQYRFSAAAPQTDPSTGNRHYRLQQGQHRLTIRLVDRTCRDSMADIEFSTQVMLLLDGREMSGCGLALR